MKKHLLIFLVIFFITSDLYSQGDKEIKAYYLEIPNLNNVPKVIAQNGKISLNFKDVTLTELFSNYTVTDFKLAFPGANSELLKVVYVIGCNPALIEKIEADYSSYFGRHEAIRPIELLYIPNDMVVSGSSAMAQPELSFVGAPQAWDISKANNVAIGIAEQMNVSHEDLLGKSVNVIGSNPSALSMGHGTQVGLIAGAATDNGVGMAAMGFNATIKSGEGFSALIPIANSGARVINMSWGSCNKLPLESQYGQLIIDQVWNSGVVLVAAAGNGQHSCSLGPDIDHYPASLNHVISVTVVGHEFNIGTAGTEPKNWKDVHLNPYPPYNGTHNINVDLSAPGRNILTGGAYSNNTATYAYGGGTSFSAPMVTGTVGLMFGINPCLFPDEIESILKLTAFKNDTIPDNLPYLGRLGAGRLDAYQAVKMAKDMGLPLGTVEVMNRIIDRWDFNLRTAPYKIKMQDNYVTGNATLDFTSRNNIEILSGDYYPGSTGFVDLKVKSVNEICNVPTQINPKQRNLDKNVNTGLGNLTNLYPNPNNGSFTISLSSETKEEIVLEIYDIYGKLVYSSVQKGTTFDVNVSNLSAGMYLVKMLGDSYNETIKFMKK
ncbi:MAG TPA: S8/S53 family peptidase [Flavobacterium sp.]|nr:S8/S53 family peptidase [Flavobacterium sp.]